MHAFQAFDYCGLDRITQGAWTGSYGHDGYMIANDATSIPAYAAVSVTGGSTYTWESPGRELIYVISVLPCGQEQMIGERNAFLQNNR